MEQRVAQLFHNNVESTLHTAESVAPLIAAAAKLLADTLISESKIMVAGAGNCGALGQIFVSTLISQLHHERPSLPAIALNAVVEQSHSDEIYRRQIRALGQPDDLLLVLAAEGTPNITDAISTAHEKGMSVLVIGSSSALRTISKLLGESDIEIPLPAHSLSTLYQVQLTTLLTLTDLIDYQLFGVGD